MGLVGAALDNVAAESFDFTLECELLSHRCFATRDGARQEVAVFIDGYDTRQRHNSAEMTSSVTYERALADRAAQTGHRDQGA